MLVLKIELLLKDGNMESLITQNVMRQFIHVVSRLIRDLSTTTVITVALVHT